jgi:hypothetical protein
MYSKIKRSSFWVVAITFLFSTLVFVSSASAQKIVPSSWDTSLYPHDYILDYYYKNGVSSKMMVFRRTGADGLSVWGKSSNPFHNAVRVIVTVPAYDQNGLVKFWYPLGEFNETAFLDTDMGFVARDTAKRFPMYVFPDEKYINYNTIANTRQAPLLDNTWGYLGMGFENPLGLRELFLVTYTAKAHSKEGYEMMQYMIKKNGKGTDDMPIINSKTDIMMLLEEGYVTVEQRDGPTLGHYAVAPFIDTMKPGVIAKDAFLWMSTRNGKPLESEMKFVQAFNCLQGFVICETAP